MIILTDIDECLLRISDCEQECYNTNGSYRCDCMEGFIPEGIPLGSHCTPGLDVPLSIYFKVHVSQIALTNKSTQLLYEKK